MENNVHRKQKGLAAVEFSIILVLMLMLLGGVVEFGRVFWYLDSFAKATRDAARFLSNNDLNGANYAAAQQLAVSEVNAAGLSAFTTANVSVSCLNSTFSTMNCPVNPGDAIPQYVKVQISGFTQVIGQWIPIMLPSNEATSFSVFISPQTTMLYMKG